MNEIFSFGYWVRRRRKALDLTQAALAREVGCAAITIRKIENDERRPSRVMAERMAASLEIPEEEQESFVRSGLGEVSVLSLREPSESFFKHSSTDDNLQTTIPASILERRAAPRHNLKPQATAFIGRETELAEIREKLAADDCRLLNLLGPGGSGKTRLAIEAAGTLTADYTHGVFFVSLAPVQTVEVIPSAIASALGFTFHSDGTPNEQLLNYLSNKQMLLILDNFEHLLDGACLVIDILNNAPDLKIVATSRARLMVTGEFIFDVRGMDYPGAPTKLEGGLEQFSAVKLFETQASRMQGGFKLSEDHLDEVIRICALLEGMPLGIVLAASWVPILTPSEIAAEIEQDLEFLEKDLRDLPKRQRGMRSVFNQSWRILTDKERKILAALSVFRGGFTRKAAAQVTDATLGDLMGLIDKTVLQRTSEGRFEVHELVRQFAAEKLENDPSWAADTRSKHSETYLRALAVWERELQGPRQFEATQEMRVEIDNIRAAWEYAVEVLNVRALPRAINGFCIYLYQSHQRVEGEEICQALVERLLAEVDPNASKANEIETQCLKLKARALAWGGFFNWKVGNWDLSSELVQKCLTILKQPGLVNLDTRFEKAMIDLTQTMLTKQSDNSEVIKIIEDIAAQFMAIEEPWWASWALTIMGQRTTSTVEGIYVYEKSLKIAKELGDLLGQANALVQLAVQYGLKWKIDESIEIAYEALEIYRALDDRHGMALMYVNIGGGKVWQGKFEEARSMEREALEMYANLGYQQSHFAWLYVGAAYPDLYLGEYQAARDQAYYAMDIYKNVKHDWADRWMEGTKDILGRVALVESAFSEAENWFLEIATLFQGSQYPLDVSNYGQNLACLGFAKRGLGQHAKARAYFYKALGVSVEFESYLAVYHILPGIALLLADQGEIERAVELYALASTQGIVANSKWFDDNAGDEITAASEELPPGAVEAAKARGRELDLWETAEALLAELDEQG